MFRQFKILKIATTLLMLVAIAATGFVPVALAEPCVVQDGVKPAACATATRCCCGTSPEARACCCRQNDTPSQPPPAAPNDTGRTLKWTPWIDAPLSDLGIAHPEQSNPLPPRSFFTPFQRTIQSLLCVWRI